MPIECITQLLPISEAEFKLLGYKATGLAFETHTALGRLFNEDIYSNELSHRLTNTEIELQREVKIKVTHKSYNKSYFIDLLVNRSIP